MTDTFTDRAERLRAYWHARRGDRAMPARKDIDPIDLPSLLSHLVLVDVVDRGVDFRMRLVGTVVRERSSANPVGRLFSEQFPSQGNSQMWRDYSRVVTERQPITADIAYVGQDEYTRRARHILFPLSSDGEAVDMVMTLVDYDRALPSSRA